MGRICIHNYMCIGSASYVELVMKFDADPGCPIVINIRMFSLMDMVHLQHYLNDARVALVKGVEPFLRISASVRENCIKKSSGSEYTAIF